MEDNGSGHVHYRCRHRGEGCALPRRSVRGLVRASVLGMRLIAQDEDLQAAIREELIGAGPQARQGRGPARTAPPDTVAALERDRRKLLQLHYEGKISADLFAAEEARISLLIGTATAERRAEAEREAHAGGIAGRFDDIVAHLSELDVEALWEAATEQERRTLVDELVEVVEVHVDHLEVTLRGAPKLNVTLAEAGLGKPGEDQSCRRNALL